MAEEGKKSFYALNLTEGRMFGIFIGIVIVLVAIFFTIFVTAFKMSKPKANPTNLRVEQIETKETNIGNKESEFSFYSDLAGEDAVKQENVLTKEVVKIESNENVTQVAEQQETIEEPQVNIDNSEILYSSKFQQNLKKETTVTNNKTESNVATKNTEKKDVVNQPVKNDKKETVAQKESSKTETKVAEKKAPATKTATSERYVVQIGSYTNKSVADEITSHYTKSGYPVYQQEFTKDGKTFYRLRVGPFKEKDRAENYLISIKSSKYGKNSYISKIYI